MDLRDIVTGIFWMIGGNLVFYLMYPMYGSFMDGFATQVVGEFGLTNTITAIGWGAYILFWIIVGIIVPIYLITQGASKSN